MILSSVAHIASMDSLHAIILLAWFEYNSERTAGECFGAAKSQLTKSPIVIHILTDAFHSCIQAFNSYTQMAMKMGMDLGLSDQRHSLDQVHATDSDQLRRTTWQSIMQLHVAGSAPTCMSFDYCGSRCTAETNAQIHSLNLLGLRLHYHVFDLSSPRSTVIHSCTVIIRRAFASL